MSDSLGAVVGDVFRVLVVGESDSIDATATALSGAFEPVSVLRERTIADARDRLGVTDVDCVVCAYDQPTDRVAFDQLRASEQGRAVPIVAVTDESRATEALEAGATDIVSPETAGRLVATRIRNAAERYRLADRRSDRRYRSILDDADAVVFVVDEEATVEFVNAAVDERMGYTAAEVERTTLLRLVHHADRSSVRACIETAADGSLGTTDRATVRVGSADGTWHVVDLAVVNRLADPSVDGLVVTVTDTTAEEPPDRALADAIERIDDVFFTVGSQWELRIANEAAETLFVPTASPESGTVIWELLPETIRGEFADRLREAVATDSTVTFETTLPATERRLTVTAFPSETGVSVMARPPDDEQPPADRARLERFEAIVDGLADGVAILDDGTITYANPALFDLVGAVTLVGREIDSLVDDELAAAIGERSQSPLVRWMEPLSGTIDRNGDDHPVEVSVMPLGSGEASRTCCVIRDRQGTPIGAVSMLATAGALMQRADDDAAIRTAVVDAVRSYTGADVVVWYRLDDAVARPTAVTTGAAGESPDLPSVDRRDDPFAPILGTDGPARWDREEVDRLCSRAGVRADRLLTVPIGRDGLVVAASTAPQDGTRIDLDPVETLGAIAELALERQQATRHAQTLDHERSVFETALEQATAVQTLAIDLFDAETRSGVERRLVEGLVSPLIGDAIELAWVGDISIGSDVVTPRTWAGRDGAFIESRSVPITDSADDRAPAGQTAASHEPTVIDAIDTDDPAEWEQLALDRGFRSALSVPVQFEEFCYGTVTLYADRPGAFDDRTLAHCVFLGVVAGYVIAAIERKQALVSDEVTELEIAIPATADPIASIADSLDSRIDIRTIVPRPGGGTTIFCTIAADSEAIGEAVTAMDTIDEYRLVGDSTERPLVELVCLDGTVAETLIDHGARLRSVTPVGARARLIVELSSTIDVRSFINRLDRSIPGVELIARREHDQTTRHDRSFEAELRDRLSDRQLRTLETAYYSGFFEWPRESTGEEVADSLGVSQPTFSRHFRLAQQKLFALLFDSKGS